MEKEKRIDNIDLLKCIGIMMVLTLHVPLWKFDFINKSTLEKTVQYAFRLISEGVPLFMFINGFLLFRKSTFYIGKHTKKILKILFILLVWGIILSVEGALCQHPIELLTCRALWQYIMLTNVGSRFTGVLWFLENLLAVYLLYPIIRSVYDNSKRLFIYLFFLVSFFTVEISLLRLLIDLFNALHVDMRWLDELVFFIQRFDIFSDAWYLFYFLLGGVVYLKQDVIEKHKVLLSFLGVMSWIIAFIYGYFISRILGYVYNEAFNYGSPFMAFFLIGLFSATFNYENKGYLWQKLISEIGKNTMGIYLSHFLIINLFYAFLSFDINLPTVRMILYLSVLFGSLLISELLVRIPYVKEIVKV